MGRLRLTVFRPHYAVADKGPVAIDNAKHDEIEGQHVETVEHVEGIKFEESKLDEVKLDDKVYRIQPRRTAEKDLPFIPSDEVKKRDGKGDSRLWIVVDKIVLDVTTYQRKHPGGGTIIAGFGGQDCSWQWWSFHNREIWGYVAGGMRVGRTEGITNPFERPPSIVGLRKHGFQDWD